MNKHSILIVLTTCLTTAYYTYVGQNVPQKEVHPPKDIQIRQDMSTDEMVDAGKEIYEGKGTCSACHKMSGGSRFPDIAGIGERAGSQKEGMSDIEYLAEALYKPNDFIVPGYNPGMPAVDGPPIGLSDQEIKAVIAYLQSLGGSPSITMDTSLKFESGSGSSAAPVAASPEEPPAEVKEQAPIDYKALIVSTDEFLAKGKTLYDTNCVTCHGAEGKGDGPAAAAFNPKPRNFTQLEGWSNGSKIFELYETLEVGILAKAMPAFNWLSPEDRFTIVHYVRSFNPSHPKDSQDELNALDQKYSFSKGQSAIGSLYETYGCQNCHLVEKSGTLMGPSLFDIGKRLSKGELYEALMDPDATVATGLPAGVMTATLKSNGFYEKVTTTQLKALVDHLASQKGD